MFKSLRVLFKENHCCIDVFSFGLSKIRIWVGLSKCIVIVFLDM